MADNVSEGSDVDVGDAVLEDVLDGQEHVVMDPIGVEVDRQGAQEGADDWWVAFLDESIDEEFEGFDADWKTENFHRRNPLPFNREGGCLVDIPDHYTAGDYFQLFFNDEMWGLLVTETNRYADQEMTRNPPPPRAPRWSPVDVPTMKCFMGLCISMGVLKLPSKKDYWRKKKELFSTSFNSYMTRDRFFLIWRYV